MKQLSLAEVNAACWALHKRLGPISSGRPVKLYGIPRGGVTAAYAMASAVPGYTVVADPSHCDYIIDDLVQSGATRTRYETHRRVVVSLFSKMPDDPGLYGVMMPPAEWLVFPWEATVEGSADDIITRFLQFIGEDPSREGLKETPKRVLKAWRNEWASGYKVDMKELLKTFTDGADGVDEMVVVKDIDLYSHCEHHMAPFFGVAHIGYVPNGKIVGLSKLNKLVDAFGRRLQVQERIGTQIVDTLMTELQPLGAGVVIEAKHLCVCSRGARHTNSTTVTSALRGCFKEEGPARAEFLALCR